MAVSLPNAAQTGTLAPAIVVTGASSGIGRELARVAARDGSFMLLLGRSQEALQVLEAELVAGGAHAATLSLDLSDRAAGAMIESALSRHGVYCDILVNNAGFGVYGSSADADHAEQLQLIDVNVRALTDLALRFLPGMIARRRGGILNVGSISGFVPGPYMALYFASKAYVRSFSSALSAEARRAGVTVTCLAPGVVRTAFFERCKVNKTRLFKLAPRSDPDHTARVGWQAFKTGKRLIVPGFTNRVITGFCRIIPDALLIRLVERLQRPHPSH